MNENFDMTIAKNRLEFYNLLLEMYLSGAATNIRYCDWLGKDAPFSGFCANMAKLSQNTFGIGYSIGTEDLIELDNKEPKNRFSKHDGFWWSPLSTTKRIAVLRECISEVTLLL